MRESELKEKFKLYVENRGYTVCSECLTSSPDLIIEKDDVKIAVETKGSRKTSIFGPALGQLLFAKTKQKIDELWLILPKAPSTMSLDWIRLLWSYRITIFFYSNDEFIKLTRDLVRSDIRSFPEIDEEILNLLKNYPNGLSQLEIIKKLGLEKDSLEGHIINNRRHSILRDKITIENDKIKLNL